MSTHLSDEELSDLADGIGEPGAADHLSGCRSCRARMDALGSVLARLGEPVPVPEARREQAVAAALAASSLGSGGRVVAVAFWRRPRVLAGIAAAAVVVAGVAFGISQSGGSSNVASSSKGGAHAPATSGQSAAAAPQSSRVSAGPLSPPGASALGPIQNPQALVVAVHQALANPRVFSGSTAPGATSGSIASSAAALPVCSVGASRFPSGSKPVLLLDAPVLYRTVAAHVFVYQIGTGRVAFVLADAGCAELTQTPV